MRWKALVELRKTAEEIAEARREVADEFGGFLKTLGVDLAKTKGGI